jgi:hypothetical protein
MADEITDSFSDHWRTTTKFAKTKRGVERI